VYGSEADPATGKWSGANTTEEVFDETIDANFRGAYFIVQNALPHMSDGGAIVFTTFWFDAVGVAGTPAVSASKAELPNLTRQWPPSWSPEVAAKLVARSIRVNPRQTLEVDQARRLREQMLAAELPV
jgi:NAD(P)-dependent dehydrogenase (short-subunit alcohol dehydrogenase family)